MDELHKKMPHLKMIVAWHWKGPNLDPEEAVLLLDWWITTFTGIKYVGQVVGLSDCNEKCMKCVICKPLDTVRRSAQDQSLFHSRLWIGLVWVVWIVCEFGPGSHYSNKMLCRIFSANLGSSFSAKQKLWFFSSGVSDTHDYVYLAPVQ